MENMTRKELEALLKDLEQRLYAARKEDRRDALLHRITEVKKLLAVKAPSQVVSVGGISSAARLMGGLSTPSM